MPLVLDPSSACDICFESFTSHNDSRPPLVIPCGHVFCRECLFGFDSSICPMCRGDFVPRRAVTIIVESVESSTPTGSFELLKKLIVSWSLEISESQRIELFMEVERHLENPDNSDELLSKTLEIIRAQNALSHELGQLRSTLISTTEQATLAEQRLKESQTQVACLTAEGSVYSQFTLELPDNERDDLAKAFKVEGNKAFQIKEFSLAVELYSRAIEVTCNHDPVFFANRAACYLLMTPPKYQLALVDCNEAIQRDKAYVKAINRRGLVHEGLQQHEAALHDFVATLSLDMSGITSVLTSVDRLLTKLATEKATGMLNDHLAILPPRSVTTDYFSNFRSKPRFHLDRPNHLTRADSLLLGALEAMRTADLANAYSLVDEALDLGLSISWRTGRAMARTLRGTFRYLTGDLAAATADFLVSLSILPTYTQNYVKLAKIRLREGDREGGFKYFEDACLHDSDDPDIYHHRGLAYLERGCFALAVEDFEKSIAIDKLFIPSHAQLALAYHKLKDIRREESILKQMLELFPTRSEPLNHYGEFYASQRNYERAIGMFERAYNMERRRPIPNIAALLNKGRALYYGKHDIVAAKECYSEAARANPRDVVPATAMYIELHLECNDFSAAMTSIKELVTATQSRNKSDLVTALMCEYALGFFQDFLIAYPDLPSEVEVFAHERFLTLTRKHLARLYPLIARGPIAELLISQV